MESSKNSEPGKHPSHAVAAALQTRGHRGGVISMHRALHRFHLGPLNVVAAACLTVFFSAIWLIFLPRICRLWTQVFARGLHYLPLHAELAIDNRTVLPFFRLSIPYFRMQPILPSQQIWWLTCAATILLFAATFLLSDKWIPVIYLSRAVLTLHATALAYFAIMPARFPHTPENYLEGLITSGMGLISIVPLLFGLTYYIFDFGMLRKAVLTSITMAYLAIFFPFQVLMQAVVLQKTVLFMPLLYIVFGIPVDILLIIAFYSWGMTWVLRAPKSVT